MAYAPGRSLACVERVPRRTSPVVPGLAARAPASPLIRSTRPAPSPATLPTRADRMRVLAAYRAFHATHAPHGPLMFGTDAPTTTGYRVWAACPCGASGERWVSVAEALADLEPGDLRRVLAEAQLARVARWCEPGVGLLASLVLDGA